MSAADVDRVVGGLEQVLGIIANDQFGGVPS
jgi:hypothetical protein